MKIKNNQIVGLTLILANICGIAICFKDGITPLIGPDNVHPFDRYWELLFISSVSIWIIGSGILLLSPKFKSANSESISIQEKYRLKLTSRLLAAPFLIFLSFAMVLKTTNIMYQLFSWQFIIYYFCDTLITGYKFKKGPT